MRGDQTEAVVRLSAPKQQDANDWGCSNQAPTVRLVRNTATGAHLRVLLTNLPADQVPACGPGLDYLWQNFPIADLLNTVFRGSGECAKIDWELFHLSMPWWTLFMFVGLGGLAAIAFVAYQADLQRCAALLWHLGQCRLRQEL